MPLRDFNPKTPAKLYESIHQAWRLATGHVGTKARNRKGKTEPEIRPAIQVLCVLLRGGKFATATSIIALDFARLC